MSWDEWEQLKADAAARGSARTQLNHGPSDAGGSGAAGKLRSDKKTWVAAGEGTKGLQDDIGKALGQLDGGQSGPGETSGCESATARKELYDSWKKYVADVGGRCRELGGLLEQSGRDLSKSDAQVRAELDKIAAKYKDTDTVGGQTKGR